MVQVAREETDWKSKFFFFVFFLYFAREKIASSGHIDDVEKMKYLILIYLSKARTEENRCRGFLD